MLMKVFKMKKELARPIIEPMLNKRVNTYSIRNFQEFVTNRKRTI